MLHPKGTALARKQTSQHKKQQRALKKRTKRKQKLVRRRAQESGQDSPRRLLRRARRMPFEGAWVQRGWQEDGEARVLIARTQPSDDLLFAGFVVDYLCTGIRESSYFANVNRETFQNEYLPRLYDGEPPLTISEAIANEIVWGSVEYANSLGFRPDSNFIEAQYILQPEGELPISGTVEFVLNDTKYPITAVLAVSEKHDLAIVRVEGFTAPALPLGDSDTVQVGETVYVTGNPKKLKGIFSEGIMSGIRVEGNELVKGKIFQMTAPISPGSSGGPALNRKAQVVGIAGGDELGAQNLNFIIPVNHLKALLATLR